jgi:hypothetical protein
MHENESNALSFLLNYTSETIGAAMKRRDGGGRREIEDILLNSYILVTGIIGVICFRLLG